MLVRRCFIVGWGSGVPWQLQPGDKGEAEGRPGEGARHPAHVTPFFWQGPPPHIPCGTLPGPTLGSGGSGRLSLSWAWPRQHLATPGHGNWVWERPRDQLETPGERGSHSLDLPERPLLHQFHFVLALEPGGERRQQSATTSPPPHPPSLGKVREARPCRGPALTWLAHEARSCSSSGSS